MHDVERNKDVVRRLHHSLWDRERGPAVRAEVVGPNCVLHWPDGTQRQARKSPAYEQAFPDIRNHLDLLMGEGDLVARRWTNEGTHLGPLDLDGFDRIEPTGRHVRWSGVNIYRLDRGRIVENWAHVDLSTIISQLK